MRTPLSFIISICLFVPYFAKGQEVPDENPLEEALRWERVVFSSDNPGTVNSALIAKAECYSKAKMPDEASKTLESVRMYFLDPEAASSVLLLRSRYSKESGDMGAALGFLEESGQAEDYPELYSVLLAYSWRLDEAKSQAMLSASSDAGRDAVMELFKKAPRQRKENLAAALSFIPPAGQIYLGRPWEGILSMILNAGAAGRTAYELINHDWVSGLLGGGLLLNETFFKANMEKNISSVDEFNRRSINKFALSLEELLETIRQEGL